jgi:hypothetical protein
MRENLEAAVSIDRRKRNAAFISGANGERCRR